MNKVVLLAVAVLLCCALNGCSCDSDFKCAWVGILHKTHNSEAVTCTLSTVLSIKTENHTSFFKTGTLSLFEAESPGTPDMITSQSPLSLKRSLNIDGTCSQSAFLSMIDSYLDLLDHHRRKGIPREGRVITQRQPSRASEQRTASRSLA